MAKTKNATQTTKNCGWIGHGNVSKTIFHVEIQLNKFTKIASLSLKLVECKLG